MTKNQKVEYYSWMDVGGYYSGFECEYTIDSSHTIFLNVFHPVNADTHAVRRDTLFARNCGGYRFLVPQKAVIQFDESLKNNDMREWYWLDKDTNDPHHGNCCYMKVYDRSLPIEETGIEWNRVQNPTSVSIAFPSPPPIPELTPNRVPIDSLPVTPEFPEKFDHAKLRMLSLIGCTYDSIKTIYPQISEIVKSKNVFPEAGFEYNLFEKSGQVKLSFSDSRIRQIEFIIRNRNIEESDSIFLKLHDYISEKVGSEHGSSKPAKGNEKYPREYRIYWFRDNYCVVLDKVIDSESCFISWHFSETGDLF